MTNQSTSSSTVISGHQIVPESFRLLYAKVVQTESATPSDVGPVDNLSAEFEDYECMAIKHDPKSPIDPITFWLSNSTRFSKLCKLAYTLIATQASSGESERIFSTAGWHTAGRKNRLEGERLSQKVF